MGRLFWKFFFFYWAAMLLGVLGVALAVGVFNAADQDQRTPLEGGPRARFVLTQASATLRHGGEPALRDLMREWAQGERVDLFAVDEAGRDILGRPVPAQALAQARTLAGLDPVPERVRRVSPGPGREYLLFLLTEEPPWWRRLVPPGPPSPRLPLFTGTLASLVFGALLAWYVAKPIRVLRGAFEALSHGRLETRVRPIIGRRADEVSELARDFDGMAQKLQDVIASQRSLLHDVSHELRSPLARLQAAIGLARQNPQRLDASLERIEQEAQRVDDLVGQLLTLSRLEAQTSDTSLDRLERTDLIDLVASVAEDAEFEAQAANRSVRFSSRGDAVADVRAELLHRAVENVVRNAVKYTAPESTVDVTAGIDQTGGTFVVTVADRGPGVAASELNAIFDPFYRSASAPVAAGGFGLGLAIARRAVESHGGRVTARNRQGGGLEIELRVPLAARGCRSPAELE